MDRENLLARLRALPYDKRDYWLLAGGAMVLYGLREETADLDLGCSSRLAARLEAEGRLYRRTDGGKRWFRCGDDLEIFEGWLRDRVVLREGIPVVSLKGLLEMKLAMGREKDLRDAERIRACLDSGAKQEAEGQA